MIAHRLTSIVNADCILVMSEWQITERWTHKELIEKNWLYAKMWKEYKKSADWTIN
jgi:ATP-binding cassette subfamily B protein